jgi:hypothetical protein
MCATLFVIFLFFVVVLFQVVLHVLLEELHPHVVTLLHADVHIQSIQFHVQLSHSSHASFIPFQHTIEHLLHKSCGQLSHVSQVSAFQFQQIGSHKCHKSSGHVVQVSHVSLIQFQH